MVTRDGIKFVRHCGNLPLQYGFHYGNRGQWKVTR